jgi:hypothetical protein
MALEQVLERAFADPEIGRGLVDAEKCWLRGSLPCDLKELLAHGVGELAEFNSVQEVGHARLCCSVLLGAHTWSTNAVFGKWGKAGRRALEPVDIFHAVQ